MNRKVLKDGMLLQLRDGSKYFYIKDKMFYWADNNKHGGYFVSDFYYDDDLKSTCNKSLDIMKIYYMGELLWERKIDWSKVLFGAKVRAWDYDDKYKLVGKFIAYDEGDKKKPFLVFIEDQKDTYWFDYCELIEEGDIVG